MARGAPRHLHPVRLGTAMLGAAGAGVSPEHVPVRLACIVQRMGVATAEDVEAYLYLEVLHRLRERGVAFAITGSLALRLYMDELDGEPIPDCDLFLTWPRWSAGAKLAACAEPEAPVSWIVEQFQVEGATASVTAPAEVAGAWRGTGSKRTERPA